MRIILASQSPRRRELLHQAGYQFDVLTPDDAAETAGGGIQNHESTADFVQRLAYQKAVDVVMRVTTPAVIIACDTVAELDGTILGKPNDRTDAERMLRSLSGRIHQVFSGLCVAKIEAEAKFLSQSAVSQLEMQPLTDSQIDIYLNSGAWMGKSGAFGYQDGHPWLKLLSGTAENVVGLPLDLLADLLNRINQE